ncbi:MAG: flagellar M-ring protein FliF [Hyphomonadaceae bacterium]|nr:flagellar M-ring protein FliF [Hyphomonadaceae bacterium]
MFGLEQLERLWSSLLGLGARRLAGLGLVGLSVFAAVGFGSYYLSRPDFETLYIGLNTQDVSRIGAALKEAGITFDVNAQGNAVSVRRGQTAQARMLLAEKGLPTSANAGYELFDKMGSMGLTSFMQEITRLRALEGEIARTIQAMKGVKGARVHIVLPDAGSFRRTRQPPSASVIIRTESVGDFSSAAAVRHLVAAAVPGMTVDQVTVLNTDGVLMAAGSDAFNASPAKMLTLEKTIGKELHDNVMQTLAPYLGPDNMRVSVALRLNTDKRQINETNFNPEGKAERSVRTVKETGSSQSNNANRPAVGVEQNIPADQATAAGPNGEQNKKQNERREELTNYEVSSKTIQTVSEGYKIESLAIAVVVNRKRMIAALGENAAPDALDKQLKEVERLVGSAAGVDAKRGDRITVAAVEFLPNERAEPAPSPGIMAQLMDHTGSLIRAMTMIAITLMLIWFGLRPATRMLLEARAGAPAQEPQLPNSAAPPGVHQATPAAKVGKEQSPNLIADLTSKLGRTPQKRLEQMIDFDEEQAAAILKQWMRGARSA